MYIYIYICIYIYIYIYILQMASPWTRGAGFGQGGPQSGRCPGIPAVCLFKSYLLCMSDGKTMGRLRKFKT